MNSMMFKANTSISLINIITLQNKLYFINDEKVNFYSYNVSNSYFQPELAMGTAYWK